MPRNKYLEMLGGEILFQGKSDDYQLYEFNLKGSAAGCLLMVKAHGNGQYWICFVGGRSPENVIDKFLAQMRGRQVKWRPDRYRSTIEEKPPSR